MTALLCPVCGRTVEIKEVKVDEDDVVKAVREERTPLDYAVRAYERVDEKTLREIVGKDLAGLISSHFNELKDMAYDLQNKTLRIKFSDGHTYVVHMYYVLEVMRYMSLAPSLLDFLYSKKIPGENDEVKEAIAYLLVLLNPVYLLLTVSAGRPGKK